MAVPEIDIKKHDHCPYCKSRKGLSFAKNERVFYAVQWGRDVKTASIMEIGVQEGPVRLTKTMFCLDCERRFYIKTEDKKCHSDS